MPSLSRRHPLVDPLACAALLTLAAAVLLLPGLGLMAAHDTTDARYLEVAREMWASGDWVTPHLAGVPHLHKPPLAYWAAAGGFSVLGATPFAGRLLEQAAVAGTAIAIFAFARRRIGGASGWIAAGVFLTSGLVFATSRALNTDLFQLLFLTCALIALFEGSAGSVAATAVAGAFLGLAMLTKGPVALLLTIVVVVPFLVLRRGERRLPAAGVALGVLLFVAIGLPWYAIQIARDPSLVSWFIDRQVMARVAGGTEGHRHGLLYLPAHFLAGTLPWTPLVLLAAWRLRPRRGERLEALDVFLGCWLIAPCLVFELSATKLASYLLPAMPAAALLVPRAQRSGLMEDGRARGALVGALGIAGAAACAASVALVCARYGLAPAWLETSDLRAPAAFALALAALATLAGGLAVRTLLRPAHPSLRLPIAAIAAIFGLVGAAIAPAVRGHAHEATIVSAVDGAEVIEYGVFEPGLLFYTAAPERFFVAMEKRRARIAKQQPGAAHLGLRHEDVAARVHRPVPTFVLAKSAHAAKLAEELGLERVQASPRYVLLANPAAAAALGLVASDRTVARGPG
ncbi:MAG TPA: glycosyltransferase family 39 protein [Myxococcota bacterium]|nr:glycosyltransferase family 39 protein [Myxococcota bacterium]